MPTWNRYSLQAHFKKRVSKDALCLQDVLGKPVATITQDDYERESIKVLSTAWICYSGEGVDNRWSGSGDISYYELANHFVDDRLLTTITSCSTDTILTCYHEHFDRPHTPTRHKSEQMVRYVEHLGNRRRGNMLRNFSVARFVPPADTAATLKAELGRVKAIPEKPDSAA